MLTLGILSKSIIRFSAYKKWDRKPFLRVSFAAEMISFWQNHFFFAQQCQIRPVVSHGVRILQISKDILANAADVLLCSDAYYSLDLRLKKKIRQPRGLSQ